MSEVAVIVILFLAALLILMADIFLPSHGVLSVVGLGFLIAAVYQVFQVGGRTAGMLAILICVATLPGLALLAIRVWPLTPIGRRIAPPNRIATADDSAVPAAMLRSLVGAQGMAITPLRPVGICEFGGRRVSCVSQFEWISPGVPVLASSLSGPNLVVVPASTAIA